MVVVVVGGGGRGEVKSLFVMSVLCFVIFKKIWILQKSILCVLFSEIRGGSQQEIISLLCV